MQSSTKRETKINCNLGKHTTLIELFKDMNRVDASIRRYRDLTSCSDLSVQSCDINSGTYQITGPDKKL